LQSYKQRVRLLEFLDRKPGLKLPEVAEDPEILSDLILNVFDDHIRSKVELRNQVAALPRLQILHHNHHFKTELFQ